MWNKVKQILLWGWKGIEVWNVLVSIGVIAVLRAWFKNVFWSWSWYEQLLLFGGSFVFLLGVLIVVFRNRISPSLAGVENAGKTTERQESSTSWLEKVLKEDKEKFASRIFAREYVWLFEGIIKTDPYFDMVVTLVNANVFPIVIRGIDGRFSIEGQECAQPAEFDGTLRIGHAEAAGIRVRQRLSKEMIKLMIKQRDSVGSVKMRLKSCRIFVQPEVPGEELNPVPVGLGEEVSVSIKQKLAFYVLDSQP